LQISVAEVDVSAMSVRRLWNFLQKLSFKFYDSLRPPRRCAVERLLPPFSTVGPVGRVDARGRLFGEALQGIGQRLIMGQLPAAVLLGPSVSLAGGCRAIWAKHPADDGSIGTP
jgi:hypothetical protein